ncbi:MAG TPA: hypothetical protein VGD86_06530 [Devosia sp.]|jgi:hypothetical protein
MTRYIAKPVRFWLAHALVLPLLTTFVLLVPVYFFTILWPGGLGWEMEGHKVWTFFLGAFVAAYLIGAGLAAIYSALLALWQWRRGGHTFPEAMLIAWAIVALALAAVTLTGSVYSYNLYFAIACAGAMPLMWLVCRWIGIVYRSVPHLQKGPV